MSGLEARLKGKFGASFSLDVEIRAKPGGITALFGRSGSGKTSVLRCLAGLLRFAGNITVDEQVWQNEVTFLPPHARSVGYVFQEANLFSHLSVRDNLLFGAKRAGLGDKHLDETVKLLGIEKLTDRAPQTLSGGERQRVAIGRALLSGPRVLLMDEPLSALDMNAKRGLIPYLERIVATANIPILYVSHDIREVKRLAREIVVMEAGQIAMQGQTAEILPRIDQLDF